MCFCFLFLPDFIKYLSSPILREKFQFSHFHLSFCSNFVLDLIFVFKKPFFLFSVMWLLFLCFHHNLFSLFSNIFGGKILFFYFLLTTTTTNLYKNQPIKKSKIKKIKIWCFIDDSIDSPFVIRSVARRKTDLMPTIPIRDTNFGSRNSLYCSTPRTQGKHTRKIFHFTIFVFFFLPFFRIIFFSFFPFPRNKKKKEKKTKSYWNELNWIELYSEGKIRKEKEENFFLS